MNLIQTSDLDLLIPLLHDAEEGDSRIREKLAEPETTAFLATDERGQTLGAAVLGWRAMQREREGEIIYIVIAEAHRGQGHGKAFIAAIVAEAARRGVASLIVGTANSSLDNIAFYQKCGFRMDSVRRDFFDYLPAPIYEDGIQMRDMIVLRYEVTV